MIFPTLMISVALFLGLLFLMAARLANGSDPAVGAAKTGQAQLTVSRRVVTEKQIIWKDRPQRASVAPVRSAPVQSDPVQSVPSYSPPAPAQTQSS